MEETQNEVVVIKDVAWNVESEETNRRLADIMYHIKYRELYKDDTLLFAIAHIAATGVPF